MAWRKKIVTIVCCADFRTDYCAAAEKTTSDEMVIACLKCDKCDIDIATRGFEVLKRGT